MSDTETSKDEIFSLMTKIKYNLMRREGNSPSHDCSSIHPDESLRFTTEQEFKYIHENYNIQNDTYIIKSHRPFLGYFLVKGRSFLHEEVKQYIKPALFKQSLINGNIVRIFSEIKEIIFQHENKINQVNNDIDQFKTETIQLIDEKFNNHHNDLVQLINQKFDKFESDLHSHDKTTWSKLYSKQVDEHNLIENIEYHKIFIEKIQEYSLLSTKTRIPKIIEIGLGNGTMSIYFSRDKLFDVYGIDNDIDVITSCINNNNKLGGYAKFLLLDIFNLDLLKRKEFDVAFSQGTMEHFNNEDLIKILFKQLEIAKYVIFSVPSTFWLTREIGNERKMTLEEWETLLNFHEFKILCLEYYKEKQHIFIAISE
jgi:hypothetical protein